MNTHSARPLQAITAWSEPMQARWKALAARERRLLGVAAVLVGLTLLWFIAIAPAWRSVQSAPAKLDRLDSQLQTMQRLAGEARSLRAAPAVNPAQTQAALKAATDSLGGAGRLVIGGDRATMSFNNASGLQVRDWLAEARTAARARSLEANLSRGAQGYSGNVVLALPSSGSGGAP